MNLSDLSIEGLTQLEARLTSDLEMVKRVKALVMEYQKMGMRSGGVLGGAVPGAGQVASPIAVAGAASAVRAGSVPRKSDDERLREGLSKLPSSGWLLNDLQRASASEHGHFTNDEIKRWVKGMVRKGEISVVEVRAGRAGNRYAAVPPDVFVVGSSS